MALATINVRLRAMGDLDSYSLQQASRLGFIAGGFQPSDRVSVYLTVEATQPRSNHRSRWLSWKRTNLAIPHGQR